MFHSQQLNSRINNIQERALQIIYQDFTSFTDLPAEDNSLPIHLINLQKLATEMFHPNKAGIFERSFFWGGQFEPPPFIAQGELI